MPDNFESPPSREEKLAGNNVLAAARYIFDLYLANEGIDKRKAQPLKFMEWIAENSDTIDMDMGVSKGATVEALRYILGLPAHQLGIYQLTTLWPFLTLWDRKLPCPIVSINYTVMIKFADGVLVPLSCFVHKDVVDAPITDADVVCMITTRAPALANTVAEKGLMALHDGHMPTRGMVDEATLKLLEALVNNSRVMLDEGDLYRVQNLVTFIQGLFPWKVPEYLKSAAARRPPQPNTQGGWDQAC